MLFRSEGEPTAEAVPTGKVRRRRLRETFGIRDEDGMPVEESVTVLEPEPGSTAADGETGADTSPPEVSDLFARLRADAAAPVADPEPAAVVVEVVEEIVVDEVVVATADGVIVEAVIEETVVEVIEVADADADVRAEREGVRAPLERDLAKRAKRALQDDQNGVLDRLRTAKGRPDPAKVAGDESERAAAWVEALAPPIAAAYTGAYTTHSTEPTPDAPADLADAAVAAVTGPLRERLDRKSTRLNSSHRT